MATVKDLCDNCGASLRGPFCSICGQRARSPIVSLREFVGTALGDLFSVDSRVWRTVLPLIFRPGALTREYISGRRERYLPPFRSYLVLSLLFFIAASLFGNELQVQIVDEPPPADAQTPRVEINVGDSDADFSCDKLQLDGFGIFQRPEWVARIRGACEKIMADSGDSLIRAFVDNIPMMMIFFIPLVALLMRGFYLLSGRKYIEHLLFLFHYHAYFFLLVTMLMIIAAVAGWLPAFETMAKAIVVIGVFYIPIYLLLAMKRVYGQSWFVTGTKFVLLMGGYAVTLFIAFASGAAYTALTL